MSPTNENYDFVIVGSGLGGLLCGCILATHGYKVVVLEKNHQIGGMLQVFSREKAILDTGVHYIGSLNPGENLYQIFKYTGILDQLKMLRLGPDCVDEIRFPDGSAYEIPEGYDRFIEKMTGYFPDEKENIITYCKKVKEVCAQFPLYQLSSAPAKYLDDPAFMSLSVYDYLSSLTSNERLRNVLAGTNSFLYAGNKDSTPFYVHALITHSYLSGAFRLIDGGSQLAILLSRKIREAGGKVLRRKKVIGALYNSNQEIEAVKTEDGTIYYGRNFISNLHPTSTIDLFGEERFLNVYKRRVRSLENSISSFTVHLIFKPESFPYLNYNIYQYHEEDVWAGLSYDPDNWPLQYFIYTPAHSRSKKYADSLSVMALMRYSEVEKWADSFNTVTEPGERPADYLAFKKQKEEQVIQKLEKVFPDIRSKIRSVYSSTPLTFRDYTASPEGSMFGIVKSTINPLSTVINIKSHIPNLYLTGQNIIMHGILGVALGSIATCTAFVDREKLIRAIAES